MPFEPDSPTPSPAQAQSGFIPDEPHPDPSGQTFVPGRGWVDTSRTGAFLEGIRNPAGLGDRAEALLQAGLGRLSGHNHDFPQAYHDAYQAARGEHELVHQAHPVLNDLGAGAMELPAYAALPGSAVGQIGGSAAIGGVEKGIESGGDPGEMARGAGEGAVGAGIPVLGRLGVHGLAQLIARNPAVAEIASGVLLGHHLPYAGAALIARGLGIGGHYAAPFEGVIRGGAQKAMQAAGSPAVRMLTRVASGVGAEGAHEVGRQLRREPEPDPELELNRLRTEQEGRQLRQQILEEEDKRLAAEHEANEAKILELLNAP